MTAAAAMTDRLGRSARWNTALLLVPGTAALFGAAVAWAADTPPPALATKPAAPAPSSTAPAPPAVAALADAHLRVQKQIAAHRRNAARLAHRLAGIRADLAKAAASSSAGTPRSGAAGGAPVGPTAQYDTSAPNQAPPPAPAAQQPPPVVPPAPVVAPAPPPPVHTSTGASG
jgi:hypothetical protein